MPPEPRNWSEAQKHLLAQDFLVAIQKELADIKWKKSYIIIDESEAQAQNRQILPLMWVFTYKFDEDGHYIKAKARLVVRGDLQPRSEEENRATTASARVLRMITVLMAMYNLDSTQRDAVNAFLNAILYEPVYTRMPPGHGIPGKI
jgi:hypothetical protein